MDFIKSLKTFTNASVYENYNLASQTGYKTGGKVKYYIKPTSVKDIRDIIEFCLQDGVEYKLIGNGTNILLSDEGYLGAVISMSLLSKIVIDGNVVTAQAGANLSDLVRLLALNGYLDNAELYAIPASVGGALNMNAGAFKKNVSDNLIKVSYLQDGKIFQIDKEDCQFDYRKSRFSNASGVIIDATFSLNNFVGVDLALEGIEKALKKRKEIQPQGRSCGSVFKNPQGQYAGELIEKAGLKGAFVNGAFVSSKHANFILTTQNATSRDVYDLISLIKLTVEKKFGVKLYEEIEYLGSF